jgi:hypothetical protein
MKREFHSADNASMMVLVAEFLSQQEFVNHHPVGSEDLMLGLPLLQSWSRYHVI